MSKGEDHILDIRDFSPFNSLDGESDIEIVVCSSILLSRMITYSSFHQLMRAYKTIREMQLHRKIDKVDGEYDSDVKDLASDILNYSKWYREYLQDVEGEEVLDYVERDLSRLEETCREVLARGE
jgi:hypothetical protein